MTNVSQTEPWRDLPDAVADAIEPEIPATSEAILQAIGREVPEYARPIEGSFGRGLRSGVDEALAQFVALVRDPDAGRDERGRAVYVALGRGELRQGRTLDSLQSAYRVGARVAWRHLAASGREAGLDPEVLSTLAEAIFAYIDELSADSVEGYTQAQSRQEGRRRRREFELAELMLREPPPDPDDVRAAARAAGWNVPSAVAVLACGEEDLDTIARRLPDGSIAATVDGCGCAIVPGGSRDGLTDMIAKATGELDAAVGPPAEPHEASRSWALARSGLRTRSGPRAGGGLVDASAELPRLLLSDSPHVTAALAERRLAPLEELTPRARERMRETALAFVRGRGNAAEMARSMHVHPQTARYRLARLRELLGDDLEDPSARLELELALLGTESAEAQ